MAADRDVDEGKETFDRAKQLLIGTVDTIFQVANKIHANDAGQSSHRTPQPTDPSLSTGSGHATLSSQLRGTGGIPSRPDFTGAAVVRLDLLGYMSTGACSNFRHRKD